MDPIEDEVAWLRGIGSAGWQMALHEVTASTNDLARTMPAWSAVRATRQTAGRGRFGRSFVSNEGGLWLSAVLPAEGRPSWSGFSLMVGCHLRRSLQAMGLQARLRWPNDLMMAERKLGGLLIEQSAGHRLIVGLGLNVFNQPWQEDPALAATTTRLADLLDPCPDLDEVATRMLDAVADAHEAMLQHVLAAATAEFNTTWQPRPVELSLPQGESLTGLFMALESEGNLRIQDASGSLHLVPHQYVERLRELA